MAVCALKTVVEGTSVSAGETKASSAPNLFGNRCTVLADRTTDRLKGLPIFKHLLNS